MSARPISLHSTLAAFSTRQTIRRAIDGASAGLLVGLIALTAASLVSTAVLPTLEFPLAILGLGAGATLGIASTRRRSAGVARDIERKRPELRNLIITGAELEEGSLGSSPEIRRTILDQATSAVGRIRPSQLWPLRRALLGLGGMIVVWIVTAAMTDNRTHGAILPGVDSLSSPEISRVSIEIIPPTYAGLRGSSLDDPSRVEALAGSSLSIRIAATAATIGIETVDGSDSLSRTTDGSFSTTIHPQADGFIAIEPRVGNRRGPRRLIGLTVSPDQPPRVKISSPAKDLFINDANRAIDLSFEADDDLGLSALAVRYTKVSGSGERFTFVEDTIPVTLERRDARHWTGRGVLRLAPLKLEAGDMMVYRAIARDKRPGAPATESDAWIVDITAPGMTAAAGFSMDDTENKYALSQQMVILKTERLLAKAPALSADSLSATAQAIAAEQRAVRAEFVFMMGGEVADEVVAAAGLTDLNEEAEAAAEADIAAGRLQNHGRVALVQSIRFMSRANTSLIANDPAKALTQEKAALAYLEQAFSRTRYLLRALTQRERLDLARRLTGSLVTASSETRRVVEPEIDRRSTTLRALLSEIAGLSSSGPSASDSFAELAQRVVGLDPSDKRYQKLSTLLDDAAAAARRADADRTHQLADSAASRLAEILRAGKTSEKPIGSSPALALLRAGSSVKAPPR